MNEMATINQTFTLKDWVNLQVHPAANMFPVMTGVDMGELIENIRTQGFDPHHPIVLFARVTALMKRKLGVLGKDLPANLGQQVGNRQFAGKRVQSASRSRSKRKGADELVSGSVDGVATSIHRTPIPPPVPDRPTVGPVDGGTEDRNVSQSPGDKLDRGGLAPLCPLPRTAAGVHLDAGP